MQIIVRRHPVAKYFQHTSFSPLVMLFIAEAVPTTCLFHPFSLSRHRSILIWSQRSAGWKLNLKLIGSTWFGYVDIMSYENSIFNISASIFSILVSFYTTFRRHFDKIITQNLARNERKLSVKGFWLFNILIDIVLTFEFCHDITVWKMTIFDKGNYFEMEPALSQRQYC